jgi:hypothetical protein
MEGLSNGGIVWDLQANLELEVGPSVRFTGLHEACRSLLVRQPFWFAAEALLVWTALPEQDSARASETYRSIGRGIQALTGFVLKNDWDALQRARRFVNTEARRRTVVLRLLHAGHIVAAAKIDWKSAIANLSVFFKGATLRFLVPNPCRGFLKEKAGARQQ